MINTVILYYVLAAAGGLLAGIFFTWLAMRGGKGAAQARAQHEALAQEFNAYRNQVDRHFVDTAEAVDELNRSYQKVVQHLSSGAQNLMGKEALQEQLALRSDKTVTVAYLAAGTAAAQSIDAETEESAEVGGRPAEAEANDAGSGTVSSDAADSGVK